MAAKRKKTLKASKKGKTGRGSKSTGGSLMNQTVTLDCNTVHIPDITIEYGDAVVFENACKDTRLLEFFAPNSHLRPVLFVQLQQYESVTVVPGPDDDCHRKECTYNIRVPGQPPSLIQTGGNKIIINS